MIFQKARELFFECSAPFSVRYFCFINNVGVCLDFPRKRVNFVSKKNERKRCFEKYYIFAKVASLLARYG